MATCVEVAGTTYPETFNGNKISPMEGVSLFRTLAGETKKDRLLTFEHQGNPAIRKGDWKLVSRLGSMGSTEFNEDAKFELYNIANDRTEMNDLSADYPDKVAELKLLMVEEFNRLHVFPKPVR